MIMVPGQHEKIQGIVGDDSTEFSIKVFGVFERDYNVVNMVANGLECCGKSGAVKLLHHVKKGHQFRAHVFLGAQSAMGGA
jgi:hypothetical protein